MVECIPDDDTDERLLNECERLASALYGIRTVVLLDKIPAHLLGYHRAYLHRCGERLTAAPSRYGECHASSPMAALRALRDLLRTRQAAWPVGSQA